ncbi:MAG: GAF domain-containing protein [Gemmatimonadota bacterium]|nr:MAG: GAF domain-containing protein [Gemmatimonadota bacterium]
MEDSDTKYFHTFWQVSKAITSTLDPKEVLKLIAERTSVALNAKGCILRLFDKAKEKFELCASHDLSDSCLKKGPVDADKSIAEAMQGNPVVVFDATEDLRVQYPNEAKNEGICSILSIPMTVKDRIIGVLRVNTEVPHEFTPDEIEYASALAEQGAIAIENATLFEKVKGDYENLMNDFQMRFGRIANYS